MATDTEFRNRLCELNCFRECGTVGHQRRRSDYAARMSLDDGPVHAGSEAKIVRIDDQTPHATSLAGRKAQLASVLRLGSATINVCRSMFLASVRASSPLSQLAFDLLV